MRYLILLMLFAASPSWAIFKCTVDGKTAFQDAPCAGGQAIKPLYEPEKIGAAPPRAIVPQSGESLEQERLRHETEYALRDKQVQLNNFRAKCDAEVKAIAANRRGFNDNVAGAMRGQAEAAAAQAYATNCATQSRTIEADLEDLRRQCAAQGCKPL